MRTQGIEGAHEPSPALHGTGMEQVEGLPRGGTGRESRVAAARVALEIEGALRAAESRPVKVDVAAGRSDGSRCAPSGW